MPLPSSFHPLIRAWFERRFLEPTPAQALGWPPILEGRNTLIAAPTGSGKTLAAFLVCLSRLLQKSEGGELDDSTEVLYISPLKALGNDIQRNLEAPLAELVALAAELGYPEPRIRVGVRSGDTTPAERQALLRRPPHILITTPESLYLMLTAARSRETLRTVRTVIVDEIHALARDKRGSHLALSLARLDALAGPRTGSRPGESPSETGRAQRVGLSATQRPIEAIARFLVGSSPDADNDASPDCVIVDTGHQRELDLAIEVPPTDLEAVASAEQWNDVYNRLAELAEAHRTTLVFVNTRRLAERIAFHLGQRLGEERVGAHHGSLAKERRLRMEQRLKAGDMKVLVATASLELGIDIGSVDLVCQIGSPRSIATFLQRVGRSGHALGLIPKGRLFATTRDELIECAALIRAVRAGHLDAIFSPVAPLDILAQQIVAEAAAQEWSEDALYDRLREATPYADLDRDDFDRVLEMLSEGIASVRSGRAASYLQRDKLAGVVRGRRNARLAALTSGGAIPEVADYRVLAEPDGALVGTVNEDFAVESIAGDIFLLGTTAWRIKRIESGVVRVEDARGAPPTVPFWLGEAPARTLELSQEVSALRREVAERLADPRLGSWLQAECRLDAYAAEQIVRYLRATQQSLGVVPSDSDVVFERFFDDIGGMQLVVHAPFGGRINRAWGLALRKRFCVTFDFELQAAATDDAFLLSLGPQHSFPLDDIFHFVRPQNARETLTQALLPTPMFGARWRWNATRSLAVLRQNGGRRVPPPVQRGRSDDLLAAVFPMLAACQENVSGPIELPDHPLVNQTVHDCLTEAMDIDGLIAVLERVERGEVRLHGRDTVEPSPMSHEILTARPYAYLDDAPLEERRARAVALRRVLPESARDLAILDPEAIERVRDEAWPQPRDPDEALDVLHGLGVVRATDAHAWRDHLEALRESGRAGLAQVDDGPPLWFAAQERPFIEALYPNVRLSPTPPLPDRLRVEHDPDAALVRLLRGQMECLGPVTVRELAWRVALSASDIAVGLAQLEGQGFVLRGRFSPGAQEEEWCERRLLARIHRYTIDRLRHEIEPVSSQEFLRFLLRWQHVAPGTQLEGKSGLRDAIGRLQGFEAAAVAWERDLLPARVAQYRPMWLDELCLAGEVAWARLSVRGNSDSSRGATLTRLTPITLALRQDLPWLLAAARGAATPADPTAGASSDVLALLRSRGALFQSDLLARLRRLPSEVESALWDLVAAGLVTSDGFQALRSLMASRSPQIRRSRSQSNRRLLRFAGPPEGRWSLLDSPDEELTPEEVAEDAAGQLLARYGLIFRDLLAREHLEVPWREVLRVLRRQEAQGLVRGGRFVAGYYGEQYALPGAVEALRRTRKQERAGEVVRLNAVDPLNLVGILTPGPRLPAVPTNAVIYRDGLVVATEEGGRTVVRAEGGEEALRAARGGRRGVA